MVLGLSPGWGRDISRRPDRSRSPPSLLCDGYPWNVVLTTHLLPVPGGEWVGTIPPLPLCACIDLSWVDLYLFTLGGTWFKPCTGLGDASDDGFRHYPSRSKCRMLKAMTPTRAAGGYGVTDLSTAAVAQSHHVHYVLPANAYQYNTSGHTTISRTRHLIFD